MMRKLLFFGVFAVLESGLVWTQNLKVHTIGDSTMARLHGKYNSYSWVGRNAAGVLFKRSTSDKLCTWR